MELRSHARALIERRDPLELAPRGWSPFVDLRRATGFTPSVIFDVGANVGQSTMRYVRLFPEADLWAFEPVPDTFSELERRVGPRAHLENLGLGDHEGTVHMDTDGPSVYARVADHGTAVRMTTLDAFCLRSFVRRIDFLKIDTEGHDLRVLEGASGMLGSRSVGALQVEAGMHPGNETHVPLEDLKGHLEDCGYRCFGIYEQVHEFRRKRPWLRRVNAVFVPA